ncbi:MAG: M20 family metallopeptidase [Chloroflexi bacterium]|nr:M20 family metallopeptidase [Chloroflexota bacterium]
MIQTIHDYLQPQREAMLDSLRALVELETPTDDKAAIDRAQAFLRAQFEAAGGRVETAPQPDAGNHLRAEFGGGGQDKPQLTILTHIDTVYPLGTLAAMPFRNEGRIARGPGIFDMKGGIVIGLYALKALRALNLMPSRKVVFLVTSDEETGSRTSRGLIESEARRSDTVLVLEPGVGPQGALKTWRKGVGGFWLTVKGRAAHAGADPERGRSAIVELAHQIVKFHALNDPAKGTTVNVGVVGGGTRSNVVAAEAHAEIDVRVMTVGEWARIEQAAQALQPATPDTTLHITGGLNRPPMERTPQAMARFAQAKQIAAQLDYALDETGTGGGSDGNFTAALGIPTIDGLGAVGNGAHSPHEHIIVGMLPMRAAVVAGLLTEL